jgi:UPF0755 protein
MKSSTKVAAVIAAVILTLGIALGYLVAYSRAEGPGEGASREIHIPTGVGPRGLVTILSGAEAIRSPATFALWLRLTGDLKHIKAGAFEIKDNATPSEIIEILSGRSIDRGIQVTIPEGFTLSRIADALEKAGFSNAKDFIKAAMDKDLLAKLKIPGSSSEGYLFPDTYFFLKSETADSLVAKMNRNFNEKLSSLNIKNKKTIGDLVTLASIVQAEAKVVDEMPIIAGVYSNRLTKPEFPSRILQADPTVAYGCEPFIVPRAKSCKSFNGKLTRLQLSDSDNPYNTYHHPGLPPGPICAPGTDALKAASSPADVPYLYFVVHSNGRHTFSSTLKEHQKAVEEYRRRLGG